MKPEEYKKVLEALHNLQDEDKYDLTHTDASALHKASEIVEENIPRYADEYEIQQSIHIGDKEVVFGESKAPSIECPSFLVAYASTFHEVGLTQYTDAMGGADYLEMMKLFLERVSGQVAEMEREQKELGIPREALAEKDIVPSSHLEDYTGKVMVVRAEVLRPEYRSMAHQLVLAQHGNGCKPHGHGRGVFTKTLATGSSQRFDRTDFLGEIRAEALPEWAKTKLAALQTEKEKRREKAENSR